MAAEGTRPTIVTRSYVLICLTGFLVFLSFFSLNGILPLYVLRVGGTPVDVGAMMALFTVAAVLFRPWVGRWADRADRRWILGAGLVVIVFSFGAYAAVRSLWWLGALRVLHGLGWAMTSTSASALVADVVPAPRRGEAMGYYANFGDVAMGVGPWLAVFTMDRLGFAATFLLGGALALAAAVPLAFLRLSHRPRGGAEGGVLSSRALLPALVLLTATCSFGAVVTFLPLYTPRHGLGGAVWGVNAFAWFYVAYALTLLAVRGPVGRISDRRGRAWAILPGMALLAGATVFLAFLHTFPQLLLFGIAMGVGFGAAQPSLMAWTIDRTPPREWGRAMGTFFAAFDLGIGISALVLGALVQAVSYRAMYLTAAAVVLAGTLAYEVAHRRRGPAAGGSP